jgi:hypothetical protein
MSRKKSGSSLSAWNSAFTKQLNTLVRVQSGSKAVRITVMEALIKQLINAAAQGDLAAVHHLLQILKRLYKGKKREPIEEVIYIQLDSMDWNL